MSSPDLTPLLEDARKGAACLAGACSGFKDFILRGDVVSLAVAVVIGNAFSALVDSFVADWLTPLIAIFFSGLGDFAQASFTVNGSVFKYGHFVNVFVTFLLTALVVYFFVVVPMNRLVAALAAEAKGEGEAAPPAPHTRECPECLSEIPAAAKRCKFCTAVSKPAPPPQIITA